MGDAPEETVEAAETAEAAEMGDTPEETAEAVETAEAAETDLDCYFVESVALASNLKA